MSDKCNESKGQCHYFVVRKKRLCRMTVRSGSNYCGEHEPQLNINDDKESLRIPCPYDSKHTCFATKLEKHLKICNAREQTLPEYIVRNVNVPTDTESSPRLPLTETPLDDIRNVINKVNKLYEENLKDNITHLSEKPIHNAVIEEFNEAGRKESSLRHLRQVSRMLHLMEEEDMVQPDTCYVELGAGKGKLAAMIWRAWCQGKEEERSNVLLVERASLRHKRDNGTTAKRLRADLADVVLERVPMVQEAAGVVAVAKHLCGVATDYSLRCVCAGGKLRALLLASCCHHRAAWPAAAPALQKLGITSEDFNIILGIVSWATCGDGRSRDHRNQTGHNKCSIDHTQKENQPEDSQDRNKNVGTKNLNLDREDRERIGRRAKALIDWGRVVYLREHGFHAKLVYYVPKSVSLENVCIVAKKIS